MQYEVRLVHKIRKKIIVDADNSQAARDIISKKYPKKVKRKEDDAEVITNIYMVKKI